MLSGEQTFFLAVLADHLNERPTGPVPGLDWKAVYDMAEKHQLTALFYAQCGAFLPPEAELSFLRDYGAAVADYAARKQNVSELDREFTRHKIPYVIVKGFSVAESYPQPELRTMGDIDIVVKPEDKERAHTVLQGLGFSNLHKQCYEWVYMKDGIEIELHHRLLYDEYANTPSVLTLADRLWDYVYPVPDSSRCELEPSFHFLFLALHLRKHIVHSGAGFRQFMDLAVAVLKWQLDWQQIEKLLTEVDQLRFVRIGLSFCRQWFRLELPLVPENQTPEENVEVTLKIFRNGVFGRNDESNTDNVLISALEQHNGDSLCSRLHVCRRYFSAASPQPGRVCRFHLLRILFPDYCYMRKLKTCSFLDGRPWLLPAGWVWRLICGGKYKTEHVFRVMMFSRKKIRDRRRMLEKMGL